MLLAKHISTGQSWRSRTRGRRIGWEQKAAYNGKASCNVRWPVAFLTHLTFEFWFWIEPDSVFVWLHDTSVLAAYSWMCSLYQFLLLLALKEILLTIRATLTWILVTTLLQYCYLSFTEKTHCSLYLNYRLSYSGCTALAIVIQNIANRCYNLKHAWSNNNSYPVLCV